MRRGADTLRILLKALILAALLVIIFPAMGQHDFLPRPARSYCSQSSHSDVVSCSLVCNCRHQLLLDVLCSLGLTRRDANGAIRWEALRLSKPDIKAAAAANLKTFEGAAPGMPFCHLMERRRQQQVSVRKEKEHCVMIPVNAPGVYTTNNMSRLRNVATAVLLCLQNLRSALCKCRCSTSGQPFGQGRPGGR